VYAELQCLSRINVRIAILCVPSDTYMLSSQFHVRTAILCVPSDTIVIMLYSQFLLIMYEGVDLILEAV
jgi:hypothetical protein